MYENAKSPHLQKQMNRVKRSLNQNSFIVFVTCITGGISLAVGAILGNLG